MSAVRRCTWPILAPGSIGFGAGTAGFSGPGHAARVPGGLAVDDRRLIRVEVTAHSRGRSEPGRRLAGHPEAEACIEADRLRVRDHVDAGRARRDRPCHDVLDESPTDAAAHGVRVDEQVVQLAAPGVERENGREAEAPPLGVDRHPRAPLGDGAVRRLDQIGVRGKERPILVPHLGRAAVERRERPGLLRPGVANPDRALTHTGSVVRRQRRDESGPRLRSGRAPTM